MLASASALHGKTSSSPCGQPKMCCSLPPDYFRTMVEVVDYLHQLGVMHRDIKPENFLLSTADDAAVLKLADFGLSTYFKPGQKFSHIVGSAYYVAPEVGGREVTSAVVASLLVGAGSAAPPAGAEAELWLRG